MTSPRSSADPVLAELGARVKSQRLRQGLSQEDVAERAAMHVSNLSRIERGQQGLRVHILLLLAAALDTTPGALLDGLPLPQVVEEEVVVKTRTRRRVP